MKPVKINNDILLIDNFYTKPELKIIKDAIVGERDNIVDKPMNEKYGVKDSYYKRMYLDDVYLNNRTDSTILALNDTKLFNKKALSIYSKQQSYPFQTIGVTNNHETRITVYPKGGTYPWHQDNVSGTRLLSFILPLDIVKPRMWTGGELIIKHNNKDIKIKPQDNQLIIFSSHLLHKVNPINVDSDLLFHGRVVINGHIGFRHR